MSTTQLYIELIIIGLESFIWMGVFLANIMEKDFMNIFDTMIGNFSSSLVFIGIIYILGIIMEGLAEIIFLDKGDKIRNDSGVEVKNTHVIWKKYNAEKYADYTRSKIRILRATVLNLPLITVAFLWYLDESYLTLLYIMVIGVLSTVICYKSYNITIRRYYAKAHALEESEEETNHN